MEKNNRQRYKWLIAGIIILAGCLIFASIAVNKILPDKIKKQLQSIDPRIKIEVESVRASILSSTIHLEGINIHLLPDSNHAIAPPLFHFNTIDLNDISFFDLLVHKKLVVGELKIDNSHIAFDNEILTQKGFNSFHYLSSLTLPFEEISIGELKFSRSKIQISGTNDTALILFITANMEKISLKKDQKDNPDQKSQFASFHCDLSHIEYSIPESALTLRIGSISFGSQQDIWTADSLHIIPDYGKYDFARKIGHQTDRIEAFISSIRISKPDWRKLIDKKLVADEIVIGSTRLSIFRDRRIAMKDQEKPMPASYFKNIPVEMVVRQFRLNPSFVNYEEFPKEGSQSGTLKIERLQMKIIPLISNPTSLHDHINMTVDGAVMGSGAVHADVYLPLKDNKPYEVTGSFTNLLLTSLNESAENLGGFHIESGLLNHLFFKFSMNKEKATGEIIGEYHDLIIDKLKKKEKSKDKFKSFVLQLLVIPKNKDQSMPVARRTGKVDYKRDPNRYFSHYMLHSLLSGVKASFRLGFVLPG